MQTHTLLRQVLTSKDDQQGRDVAQRVSKVKSAGQPPSATPCSSPAARKPAGTQRQGGRCGANQKAQRLWVVTATTRISRVDGDHYEQQREDQAVCACCASKALAGQGCVSELLLLGWLEPPV